jgi:hypothetical protein
MYAPSRPVIQQYFAALSDPQVERTERHAVLDIITIAVCAVVARADSFVDIEAFGQARHDWFASFLALPNSIPSNDTFGRVLARLDPAACERCFVGWVQSVMALTNCEVVAIAGKLVRRSHDRGAGRTTIDLVGHCAENLAVLQRMALNLVRLDRSRNGGHHTKRLTAVWDHDDMLPLLSLPG